MLRRELGNITLCSLHRTGWVLLVSRSDPGTYKPSVLSSVLEVSSGEAGEGLEQVVLRRTESVWEVEWRQATAHWRERPHPLTLTAADAIPRMLTARISILVCVRHHNEKQRKSAHVSNLSTSEAEAGSSLSVPDLVLS